jgi:hypothetical protein
MKSHIFRRSPTLPHFMIFISCGASGSLTSRVRKPIALILPNVGNKKYEIEVSFSDIMFHENRSPGLIFEKENSCISLIEEIWQ